MTDVPSKRPSWMTNPIVIAVVISLLIHLGGFGIWKLGRKFDWWKANRFSAWIQEMSSKLLPTPKIAELQQQNRPQEEPTMTFIEVDPAVAVVEPPKEAKFQGAVSTKEASPKEAEEPQPQVNGDQREVLKLTDNSTPKALPLQPTAKIAAPEKEQTEAKPIEEKPKGDLAFAKPPEDKPKPNKTDAQKGKDQETRTRPRTLAEARKRSGTLGPKMQQDGGSKVLDLSSSLDVKGTALGDYVAELVEAVKQRWFKELEEVNATTPGKVVIEFRLHSSGRVTNVKVGQSDVGEMLSLLCQKAVQDPSPYRPWPTELRHEMNADYRDVSFTFHYLRN